MELSTQLFLRLVHIRGTELSKPDGTCIYFFSAIWNPPLVSSVWLHAMIIITMTFTRNSLCISLCFFDSHLHIYPHSTPCALTLRCNEWLDVIIVITFAWARANFTLEGSENAQVFGSHVFYRKSFN